MNENDEDAEIRKRIEFLDRLLETWKNQPTTMTLERVEFLSTLANKNLRNLSNKQGLNDNQRSMKTLIQQHFRDSFSDIDWMIQIGFVGRDTIWNPKSLDSTTDREPFQADIWLEIFPINRVCNLVKALTKLYGDDYAIPIANAIKEGLESNEQRKSVEIDVPVIRRHKRSAF